MSDSDEIAIRVEHVSKDFLLPHEKVNSVKSLFTNTAKKRARGKTGKETQHALKDISFEIKKGEFFGIVGRNGSGKSTLLKILAGIYQPTFGKTYTEGKLVPFIELGVGFNPELTGRENVYLNGALLGFSQKEIEVMYDDVVSFSELERFMDQKLKNYSSGMQVRLAFSMATRAKADILLVDEVLAVGDADFQRKCFEYFKSLKKSKKTVIFVSHDMDAVRKYCDRAAFIEKSSLVAIGQANGIATQYTKMFFEEPEHAQRTTPSKRWGTSTGLINAVTAPEKIGKTSQHLILKLSVVAKENLEEPITGFIIKNASGQIITGSNTRILDIKTGSYVSNEKFSVQYEIENIFSDGNYDVDVAVIDSDGVTVLDWWESASQFSVFEDKPSNYLVSPGVNVKIVKDSR